MKALESFASGDDPQFEGVMKLVEPYRLEGPNPRPEVLACIFNVMSAMGGSSRVRTEHQQRAENTCPNPNVHECPRDTEHARHGKGSRHLAKTAAETAAP